MAKKEDQLIQTLVEDPSGEHRFASPRAWLIGVGSAENNFVDAGRVFTLEDVHTVRFGRARESSELEVREGNGLLEVGIPLGWVSGRHAELSVGQGPDGLAFELRDLGSRNGTLIAGQAIAGRRHLASGAVFEVGRSFWMVREVRLRKPRTKHLSDLDPAGTCSPRLHHIHRTLHRLAGSSIPILLRGETGSGKEFLARAIHRVSGRDGPFVIANLGAVSDDRVEPVLFGKAPDQPGLFEQANGGTLMLDELGELSPTVQAKLLSALAEGRAARVGDNTTRSFDVRIISGTLHNLEQKVSQGRFRPDLFSRLAGFVAELPPLRDRREDMGLLIRTLLGSTVETIKASPITTSALRRILAHSWPFNVRQLNQTLGTASLLASSGGAITPEVLDEVLDRDDDLPGNPEDVKRLREELLRNLVEHRGDTAEVARAMERAPDEIDRWIERFELNPDAYRH